MATIIATMCSGGWPIRCPICGGWARMEPSYPSGDAPCPRCGHLLWFDEVAIRASRARNPTRRRSPAYAIGRRVASVVLAVRGLVPRAGRKPAREVASSSSGGVWDAWLDG